MNLLIHIYVDILFQKEGKFYHLITYSSTSKRKHFEIFRFLQVFILIR